MIDINKLKIVTLCENSVADLGLMGEWGFSVLVDLDGENILFDTGAGLSIIHNAHILDIDLSTINKIVLSHGHKDHTAGLLSVLEKINAAKKNKKVEIILHPDAFDSKYFQRTSDDKPFTQGIPFDIKKIESLGGKLIFSKIPVWIREDIVTSGEILMQNDYEAIDNGCLLKNETDFIQDPLNDDLALFIKTTLGLVVILGCAHRGLINTIHQAQRVTGMKDIFMAIGGTHLSHASKKQISSTISELKRLGIKKLGASHCTGNTAGYLLASGLQNNFFYNNAGSVITFFKNQIQVKEF